jgi:hypothetical protein
LAIERNQGIALMRSSRYDQEKIRSDALEGTQNAETAAG